MPQFPCLLSPATADDLTGVSPYFFRIVPPNSVQTQAELQIANKLLHATQIIALVDPANLYSQNLEQDFEQQFMRADQGHKTLVPVDFTAGKTTTAKFSANCSSKH